MNAIVSGRKRKNGHVRPQIMALEPRWMFDGAAVADAAHIAADAAAKALIPVVAAPVEIRTADPAKDGGKTEAVFIDTSVFNWQALVSSVAASKPGVEIDLIDGSKSGLAQIATWAETHAGYDAIHVLSQGGEAKLTLGSDTLTDASLTGATTQAELAEIGHALKAGGELALYGSSIGAGADGQQFLADLSANTGAVVAASDHAVGDASKGGTWTLDTATGTTNATPLSIPGYLGTLGIGDTATDHSPAPVLVQAADAALDGGKLEVAFVDTSVTGWQSLVIGLENNHPGVEIQLIDGTQSGLAQMVAWADTHSNYDAIHLLSGGSQGQLTIGTDTLAEISLSNTEIRIDLHRIAQSLNTGGDILALWRKH